VLEVDPDLGRRLDEAELVQATRQAVGVLEVIEPGPWQPRSIDDGKHLYGGLIFEGILVRELSLGTSVSAELLGEGDVIVPYDGDEPPPFVPAQRAWTALEPVRIAWLDAPFAVAVRRWPQLGIAVLERAQRRSDRLAVTQAISQVTRVDDRVLALLWHLSERWGRIGPTGVLLPMRLTHKAIARLVGARRPSVTTAISALERRGLIARRADGAWVLGTPERLAVAEPGDADALWEGSVSLVGSGPGRVTLEERLAGLSETFARAQERTRELREGTEVVLHRTNEARRRAQVAREARNGATGRRRAP